MEVWGRVYLLLVPSLLILDKFLLGLQKQCRKSRLMYDLVIIYVRRQPHFSVCIEEKHVTVKL